MIIVTKVSFPLHKAQAVAEKYLPVISERPEPDGVKHLGPFIKTTLDDGVVAMSLYEVDKGKELDAYKHSTALEFQFREIEGYRYTVDIYYTLEEALALFA